MANTLSPGRMTMEGSSTPLQSIACSVSTMMLLEEAVEVAVVVVVLVDNVGSSDGLREMVEGASQQGKNVKLDVHSALDSPMLETMTSFGLTSSLLSLTNLPLSKVHVKEEVRALQERKVGISDD